jgi:hypothetical protein
MFQWRPRCHETKFGGHKSIRYQPLKGFGRYIGQARFVLNEGSSQLARLKT